MFCSVFFAFDNGVITLLVQMGALIFTDEHPSLFPFAQTRSKKREFVTNRN